MKYQRPKGTQDHLNLVARTISKLSDLFFAIVQNYGYKQVIVPTFENVELYQRQMPTSDVVTKELYEFFDRKKRHLALRPEFTAGVARAVVENNWSDRLPLRLAYCGNVFRYERPQANRYREFIQFGCELFGDNSPVAEGEIIQICQEILSKLNIKDVVLFINNIGSANSRLKWVSSLKIYFEKHVDELTELSRERIQTNPLRILDDKIDGQKDFVKAAPTIDHFLSADEKSAFKLICEILDTFKIAYQINKNLVRGLDYYTNFVFEFVGLNSQSQSQDTLIAGGRYNGLVKEIGGKDLAAIGFSIGMERLVNEYLKDHANAREIENELKVNLVIGLPSWNRNQACMLKLAKWFRDRQLKVITLPGNDFDKKLKIDEFTRNISMTKKLGARYYIDSVSEDQFAENKFTVYDVVKKQRLVDINITNLLDLLKKKN